MPKFFRRRARDIEGFPWQPGMDLPFWAKGAVFEADGELFIPQRGASGGYCAPGDWVMLALDGTVYPVAKEHLELFYEEVP